MFTRMMLQLPSPSSGGGTVEERLAALERQYRSLLDALVQDRLALNNVGSLDISEAVINGTPIGNINASTGAFTGVDFPNAGGRITGDMSNDPILDRLLFQTSVTNNSTVVGAIPNGTSQVAFYRAWNSSTPDNSTELSFGVNASGVDFAVNTRGTGSYLPINFYNGGFSRMHIATNGNIGIGTSTFGTSAAGVLGIKNSTAPTTGPADTVQFYSSDDAAGHTIPSFYCEGTNVVATGQADSASSVRVKMRINGTVRTFLCI